MCFCDIHRHRTMKRKFFNYLNFKRTHCNQNKHKNVLYREVLHTLAPVSECERDFFWKWCRERYIDDVFTVQAIVYWIRIKNNISISFLLRDANKTLYMILCIHLSMKFHGYDEMYSCNFIYDLTQIYPEMTPKEHCRMEVEVLNSLGWELL